MEKILDLARWAPSGDNTQPWRFEIVDDHHLVVHGHDTRDHCVYDLQGHASQLSLGALLETIDIAASGHQLATTTKRRTDTLETQPTFDIEFIPDPGVAPSPLIPYIRTRTVQRRAMRMRPLSASQKSALEAAVMPGYQVLWLESLVERLRATRLIFKNAGLRLTLPEAYPTHRDVIQWGARYSEEQIPERAVGLDPLTARLTRWALQRWERVAFLNRYLAGTLLPRVELELVPGIACAAHFVLISEEIPETIDDYVAAGRAVQSFWLTATRQGLFLQPELTPVVFDEYVKTNIRFSANDSMQQRAHQVSAQLRSLVGNAKDGAPMFMGRIGVGPAPTARSYRRPLGRLILPPQPS